MGRVVAQAITGTALVEDSQQLLAALGDLEAPHFSFLAQIGVAEGKTDATAMPLPDAIRWGLIRHGLVRTGTPYDGGISVAGLTDFGKRLIRFVEEGESDALRAGPGPVP